jgi:hypothetical protein
MRKQPEKKTTLAEALRESWRLTLVLALAALAVVAGIYQSISGVVDTAVTGTQVTPLNPSVVMDEEQMREVLFSVPAPQPPTIHEKKISEVNAHRARYDANPQDPDAEALLRAMGNLYKQTGDLRNAAWAYQQLLKRFPQTAQKSGVCMELAACFEQIGDRDNLTRLYLGMMRDFPRDSNEYKYAEASLHISDLKLNRRDPDVKPQHGPEGTFMIQTLSDGTVRYVDSESPAPPLAGAVSIEGSGS